MQSSCRISKVVLSPNSKVSLICIIVSNKKVKSIKHTYPIKWLSLLSITPNMPFTFLLAKQTTVLCVDVPLSTSVAALQVASSSWKLFVLPRVAVIGSLFVQITVCPCPNYSSEKHAQHFPHKMLLVYSPVRSSLIFGAFLITLHLTLFFILRCPSPFSSCILTTLLKFFTLHLSSLILTSFVVSILFNSFSRWFLSIFSNGLKQLEADRMETMLDIPCSGEQPARRSSHHLVVCSWLTTTYLRLLFQLLVLLTRDLELFQVLRYIHRDLATYIPV